MQSLGKVIMQSLGKQWFFGRILNSGWHLHNTPIGSFSDSSSLLFQQKYLLKGFFGIGMMYYVIIAISVLIRMEFVFSKNGKENEYNRE